MLKELIISYNDITSEGAQDLAKGLQVSYGALLSTLIVGMLL